MKKNIKSFGLALGGGGSRAFFHLGVLARLEEAGLKPAYLSGSSMGAVLGALYAQSKHHGKTIPRILDFFRKSSLFGSLVKPIKNDGLVRRKGMAGRFAKKIATASVATTISFTRGLRKLHPANKAIDHFFPDPEIDIDSLPLPFGMNALDLTNGKVRNFTSGSLAHALKAGVAIGLVFKPYHWEGIEYADAAPLCPVPVSLCRQMGAQVVMAVDICAPLEKPLHMDSGFDVVRRIMSIQSEELNSQEIGNADLVLKTDVSDIFWADFSKIDELYERGHTQANTILDPLREKLAGVAQ